LNVLFILADQEMDSSIQTSITDYMLDREGVRQRGKPVVVQFDPSPCAVIWPVPHSGHAKETKSKPKAKRFVSRVNRRMAILMLRFWRST
jgi:hypothetical protein